MIIDLMRSFLFSRHIALILVFALFLQGCQSLLYGEEYLIRGGDVPALRIFEVPPKSRYGQYTPSLRIFSSQSVHDMYEKPGLKICSLIPYKSVTCYIYSQSTREIQHINSKGVNILMENILISRVCPYRRLSEKVPSPFRVESEKEYFGRSTKLWFGETQVSSLAAKHIIQIVISPDKQNAAILSSDSVIYSPTVPAFMPLAPLLVFRKNTRTSKFQHYHQFFSLTDGTLSEPIRLPLAINGYPMHGCWSPDSQYVIYYGGADYGGMVKPEKGGKFPDYAAIVPLEKSHE